MPAGVVTMRSWFAVTVAFLALLSSPALVRAEAPAAPASTDKLFMWKATGTDGATAWLLGSIHVGKPDFYPLPTEVESAYAASDALVVEANVANLDQVAFQGTIMAKGMYPAGQTLAKNVAPETHAAVADYLRGRNMPPNGFDQLRPWTIFMVVTMLEMQRQGFDPKLGIDMHLLKRADQDKKQILELESAQLQIDILSGLPPKVQEDALAGTLKNMDELGDQVSKMVDAWKAGDADLIEQLALDEQLEETPELKPMLEKLFDERNVAMAEKIDAMLKQPGKTHFVVVGAGHLVSDMGLVKLLQEKGYAVEQVTRSVAPRTEVPEPAGAK